MLKFLNQRLKVKFLLWFQPVPHPTTLVSRVISRAKLCAKDIGSVPTKSMCEESSESAKLGFEETIKVETQMPKQAAGDVVTDSKGLENL